jgi:uncharacterized protein
MQCPVDGTALAMSDRQGIEIDYCPKCRGVWLDRGELDKLIERSTEFESPRTAAPAPVQAPTPQPQHYEQPRYEERREHRSYDDDDYRHDKHHDNNHGYHKKKKESFLGDMFDF